MLNLSFLFLSLPYTLALSLFLELLNQRHQLNHTYSILFMENASRKRKVMELKATVARYVET